MPRRDIGQLQLKPRHLAMLQRLLVQHVPEAQVWAYGSRMTGGGHEGSDLDLVLRNPDELTQPCPGMAALVEALQDSDLPMLMDMHDWVCLSVAFHRNIERSHVELQRGQREARRSSGPGGLVVDG